MVVRPRSSEKNAWLLSAPSTVLLLSSAPMPRKESRPLALESGVTPGVSRAKSDQRRVLEGRSWTAAESRVVLTVALVVSSTGARSATRTDSWVEPGKREARTVVTVPMATVALACQAAKDAAAAVRR